MVLDILERAERYVGLHPAFPRAFAFLRRSDLTALEPGRHELDGDRVYVLVDRTSGRGRPGARFEAHRRYIDIQFTIHGVEEIGWAPVSSCRAPAGAFDPGKDIGFFDDRPDTWMLVPAGRFAIFFPEDAHAPLAGSGPVTKAVVKIAVDGASGHE